jgi:NAD dependent epimerase/dehydratase family enzyme
MVKVALAGGTSGMGLNILNAILATKKHQVVLLSRSPKPELSAKGIDVWSVDYDSHDFLVKRFEAFTPS